MTTECKVDVPPRIREILSKSMPLENAATLYLRKQCGYVPEGPATHHLMRHPLLGDYAHGKGFYPALVVRAVNEATGNVALEVIYLTADGELAPIKESRLLLGALAGASVKVQDGEGNDLIVCERLEDALCLARRDVEATVIAAIRRSNVLNLPILQEPGRHRWVQLNAKDAYSEELYRKWMPIELELAHRGFHVFMTWGGR